MASDGPCEPAAKRRRSERLAAVTDIVLEKAVASWEIRSYSFQDKTVGRHITSPVLVEAAGARFFLKVFLGGDDQHPGVLSVQLLRERDSSRQASCVRTKYSVVAAGDDDRQLEALGARLKTFDFDPDGKLGVGMSFPIARVEEPPYLVDDTLVIRLEVTAWDPRRRRQWTLPAAPGSPSGSAVGGGAGGPPRAALAGDLAALLAGGRAADVEVSGGLDEPDGPVVRAHRVVLAARSPVFDRMLLEPGMRESEAGARVCLEGADHAVAREFVRFLYTDELGQDSLDSPSSLCHLLALAHRFEVRSLVQLCSSRLTMTEDTAVDQLVLAEQLGLSDLKEKALDYILSCRSRLALIQKTEAFARMVKHYPHLLSELFARVTATA